MTANELGKTDSLHFTRNFQMYTRNFSTAARVWGVDALPCLLGSVLHFQPEGPGRHPPVHKLLQSIRKVKNAKERERIQVVSAEIRKEINEDI